MRRGSWAKYQTDEGYEYYYDLDTQNSQWERPQDYASDHEEETGVSADGIILEQQLEGGESYEPNSNQAYEYNETDYATEYQQADEPKTHTQPVDEETLHFEYNSSSTLFEELVRLTLFHSLQLSEKTALRSGQWSKISCRKLEVAQHLLVSASHPPDLRSCKCVSKTMVLKRSGNTSSATKTGSR
jgi:hypothetical protein